MSGIVQPVTMENFDSVLDSNPIVILDFWASWCQPCKVFAPAYQMMAEMHPEVFFGSVNVEEADELAKAFLVRSIPTIIAFKNGDVFFETSGLLPSDQFEILLQKLKEN